VVDVELVLAVDVSYSMSMAEQSIQRDGYAAALTNPQVLNAIRDGLHQQIAVTFVEWAGGGSQNIVVPWTLIASSADAEAVAAMIRQTGASRMRRTSISGAIGFGSGLFDGNGFRGMKRVIDVSGDGPNNDGTPVVEARDAAVNAGIIINGLPLMTSGGPGSGYNISDLDEYYINCVIGGPGAFSLPVVDWQEFPAAVRRKLVLELADAAPERPGLIRIATQQPYDCMIGEKLRALRERYEDR
jgi:hypothetical protein